MQIQIVIFERFDDLDAFGPYEVLVNAAQAGADATVELVTLTPVAAVTSSHGARVVPHGVLGEPDLLIVPCGGWNDAAPEGARAQAERGELPAALAARHARGGMVASVCTGGGILAASGLVDDRPLTTHRGAREELRARGLEVLDARVVDDGDVLSAAGVTSGLDLALHLVEREWGERLAAGIAREMEWSPVGEVHRGPRAR